MATLKALLVSLRDGGSVAVGEYFSVPTDRGDEGMAPSLTFHPLYGWEGRELISYDREIVRQGSREEALKGLPFPHHA